MVNAIACTIELWMHLGGLRSSRIRLSRLAALTQCYVIKQMVNAIACTIELWMHLGGLRSTQEARVALGYRLVRLLAFTTTA